MKDALRASFLCLIYQHKGKGFYGRCCADELYL